MFRISLAIGWITLTCSVMAQAPNPDSTLHKLLTQERCDACVNYRFNVANLAPAYYEAGQLDSIVIILAYWEEHCGRNTDMDEIRDLLGIIDPTVYPPIGPDGAEERVARYLNAWSPYLYGHDYFGSLFSYQQICEMGFDELMNRMARDADEIAAPGSYEHLMCLIYLHDDDRFFEEVKSGMYTGTRAQLLYNQKVEEVHYRYGCKWTHYAFQMGAWIPNGANELLGSHMSINGMWGHMIDRWQLDLELGFRFLRSKNDYLIHHHGELVTSHQFESIYLGMTLGRQMARLGRFEADGLGGIGYEGLTAIYRDDDKDDDGKRLHSLNLNAGARLRFFLTPYRTSYIGLDTRYNWLFWNTQGGSDLSGGAATVMLTVGFYPKPGYKWILEQLHATPNGKPPKMPKDMSVALAGD